ncbi:DUF5133 domain-containing protein [Streptomyces sp. Je 1-4]|uniref:DUF5133 domain-containing protein n=2 Tax=Streptomyces TaxID=1883 RepID=UPI00140EC899|nr:MULTISPECIES: DUF5133 domain-containing protein [unclassified Streptomyces]QIK10842.1 DUF5133 domain-containing protein [Streptomyces sp. ID38640]UYB37802.1 DUF5133 domain-containing protein [Streptomyces sp. Je 1-4]UZQ33719.1 DUF5133 domain-containing protein [Streptomyces sp. Je 1-4] [Streptomyces sp. Je 1-4 4N24]UZQ41137.1 DUF5133 domain-containing protein [Streptomyces sp. Je 1-4] [Streptomyces sp. Je 1-4 4N24_ara]
MLMAHPAVLRKLVDEYEALQAVHAERGDAEPRGRIAEVACALCISTGTSDVDAALIAAHHQLPGAQVHDDSLLAP